MEPIKSNPNNKNSVNLPSVDWRYSLFILLALLAACQGDPNHDTGPLPTFAPTAVVPTPEPIPTVVESQLVNPFATLLAPYLDAEGNLIQPLPYEKWKDPVQEIMSGPDFEIYMSKLLSEAPKQLTDSLIHIGLMDSPTGVYGYCSGTLLGVFDGHLVIASSAHCFVDLGVALESHPEVEGYFTSENYVPKGLTMTQPHKGQGVHSMIYDLGQHNIKYDPRRDLALIRVPMDKVYGEVLNIFPLASNPAYDSEVYYNGIPYFTGEAYAGKTRVSRDPYFIRGASYQSMGGINFPGMSGGPVVDQEGIIVGILGSITDYVGHPSLNIFTPITTEIYNVVNNW